MKVELLINPLCLCDQEKKQEICVYCEDYPCTHFQQLARRYPNLIADGEML